MSLGPAALGRQERLDQVPGHRRADGSTPHAQDIHVIVLDPLPSGEVIVDQRGADASDLIGTHRRADAAAADRHSPIHVRRDNGLASGTTKSG